MYVPTLRTTEWFRNDGTVYGINEMKRLEAAIGIEPMNKGFADLCLTTWLRRQNARMKDEGGRMKNRTRFSVVAFSRDRH